MVCLQAGGLKGEEPLPQEAARVFNKKQDTPRSRDRELAAARQLLAQLRGDRLNLLPFAHQPLARPAKACVEEFSAHDPVYSEMPKGGPQFAPSCQEIGVAHESDRYRPDDAWADFARLGILDQNTAFHRH